MVRSGTFQGPTGPYERALSSVHPPDNNIGSVASAPGNTTGGGTTPTPDPTPAPTPGPTPTPIPAPVPIPRHDYTAEIATLRRYIKNLEAVKKPSPTQKAELNIYIARLADYINRQSLGQ